MTGRRDAGRASLPAALELKPKAVFAALRLGMSGQSVTPGLFESLWVLGRDEAVPRGLDTCGRPALATGAAAWRPATPQSTRTRAK